MKRVLVVDDSESVRQQVTDALAGAGFDVVQAGDGMSALMRASENTFSAIVLDVNMPILGGVETLERLKQDPKTSNISVIMLTTEAQRSMIERARQSGAKAWLIKPVKMESLVSTVLKIAGAP